jgi:paraquat-inducible protein B
MTDTKNSPGGDAIEAPEPIVERGRSLSLIWVIPIVAVIAGASIGIHEFRNRGIHLVITLPSADWIEAGKTKIRYLNIEVGTVDDIRINEKADGVELHCTIDQDAKKYLTNGAKFWLVYPKVGAGGISGLGTLVSGAYISVHLGPVGGKAKHRFAGLTTPPLESEFSPGLTIRLHAEQLNSLDVGSPVYYREIKVGVVERHELAKDGSGVDFSVFIPPEHADLVREDSRFWNAGGIQISGSIPHLQIQAESLDAIISGGIAFDSPLGEKAAPAAKDSEFWLHPTLADVEAYPLSYGGLRIYVEGPTLGSVAIADSVFYREVPVGAVVSQELMSDSKRVRIGINIQRRYAALVRTNSVFWNASGISASFGLHGLQIHAESIHSILFGGIAFATPNSPGDRVKSGSVFELNAEVKDDWLKWSPSIWRGPAAETPAKSGEAASEAGNSSGDAADKSVSADASASSKEGGAASRVERFFHHEKKSEQESLAAGESEKDASQESARETKRHEFFRGQKHGMNRH